MASPETLYSPQLRSERLIATGRVLLAASSLAALWLDPSEPARHASVAYGPLAAYLGYAALAAAPSLGAAPPTERWRRWSHAFDLGFFTLFLYFTTGPSSPFVAFYVFSLI